MVAAAPVRPSCDHVPMSIVVTELPEVGITVLLAVDLQLLRRARRRRRSPAGGRPGPAVDHPRRAGAARPTWPRRRRGGRDPWSLPTTSVASRCSAPVPRCRCPYGSAPTWTARRRAVRGCARWRRSARCSGTSPGASGSLVEVARSGRHVGYDGSGARFPDRPAHWLTDGETLAGASDWQVLHTPGHTDDSTSLWNERPACCCRATRCCASVVGPGSPLSWSTRRWPPRPRNGCVRCPSTYLLPGHGRPVVGGHVMDHALGPGAAAARPRSTVTVDELPECPTRCPLHGRRRQRRTGRPGGGVTCCARRTRTPRRSTRSCGRFARPGSEGASLPVGVDPDGRERLEFIEGDVPLPPYPAWARSDGALASVAELMARFHRGIARGGAGSDPGRKLERRDGRPARAARSSATTTCAWRTSCSATGSRSDCWTSTSARRAGPSTTWPSSPGCACRSTTT